MVIFDIDPPHWFQLVVLPGEVNSLFHSLEQHPDVASSPLVELMEKVLVMLVPLLLELSL